MEIPSNFTFSQFNREEIEGMENDEIVLFSHVESSPFHQFSLSNSPMHFGTDLDYSNRLIDFLMKTNPRKIPEKIFEDLKKFFEKEEDLKNYLTLISEYCNQDQLNIFLNYILTYFERLSKFFSKFEISYSGTFTRANFIISFSQYLKSLLYLFQINSWMPSDSSKEFHDFIENLIIEKKLDDKIKHIPISLLRLYYNKEKQIDLINKIYFLMIKQQNCNYEIAKQSCIEHYLFLNEKKLILKLKELPNNLESQFMFRKIFPEEWEIFEIAKTQGIGELLYQDLLKITIDNSEYKENLKNFENFSEFLHQLKNETRFILAIFLYLRSLYIYVEYYFIKNNEIQKKISIIKYFINKEEARAISQNTLLEMFKIAMNFNIEYINQYKSLFKFLFDEIPA